MLTALPSSFLEPLLSFSLTEDPEVRLLVLQILLSLIDRHDNTPKFSNIRCVRVPLCVCVCVYHEALFVVRWSLAVLHCGNHRLLSTQHHLRHLCAKAQS